MNVIYEFDNNRVIATVCHSQFPGAVHDARAFRALELSDNPEQYFTFNQYLIGDSAYEVTEHMITPYKKPRNGKLCRDKRQFNKLLSIYSSIEHK